MMDLVLLCYDFTYLLMQLMVSLGFSMCYCVRWNYLDIFMLVNSCVNSVIVLSCSYAYLMVFTYCNPNYDVTCANMCTGERRDKSENAGFSNKLRHLCQKYFISCPLILSLFFSMSLEASKSTIGGIEYQYGLTTENQ